MNKLIQYVLQNHKLQPSVRKNLIYICKEISIPVAVAAKCVIVGHIKTVIQSSVRSYSFISIHACSLYLLPNIYINRVLVNTKSQT